MLELKNIKKDYPAGDGVVHALRGVDLRFRKSEFVSILGPSGCGKTTMLNIIGGLDQYTEGDLVINGKSTKDFKDRDWDSYRNHSIGFVFQSYNLIPHQTVLQNVELALTLSGVSKSERRERAKKALEEVGLETQLNKKPSEMSGGQMQRVAIARALVNNPDIILADEPTGALDTTTSLQVMEILKEISKSKLIIMVTHNPDIAEKYSSRIINILDGEITGDSNPMIDEEYEAEQKSDTALVEANKGKKVKMPSMSFATSFSLSLKNLLTKKGRTMLTSFAGSIGIIGIALILAISQGMTEYIDEVQEETLTSYPLTIESTTMDMSSIFEALLGSAESGESHGNDAVYSVPLFYDMVDAMSSSNESENDLKAFKEYLDTELDDDESELSDAISAVQYTYDMNLQVYTKNVDGEIVLSDATKLMQELMTQAIGADVSALGDTMESMTSSSSVSSMFSSGVEVWEEMLEGKDGEAVSDMIKEQYDVVYGEWPEEYNEIVLVLNDNNELNDLSLYALGLKSKDDMEELINSALNNEEVEFELQSWSYEEICDMDFHVVPSYECYEYVDETGTYTDLRESDTGLQYLYDNGVTLKVTGIIKPNEDATATMLSGAIGYTSALTDYLIEGSDDADIIAAQLADEKTDVLTGLPFEVDDDLSDSEKAQELVDYINGLSDEEKIAVYTDMMSVLTDDEIAEMITEQLGSMSREEMEDSLIAQISEQMSMDEDSLTEYVESIDDDEFNEMLSQLLSEQITSQYASQVAEQLSTLSSDEALAALEQLMSSSTDEQKASYYDNVMPHEISESTYEDNLVEFGYVELDTPSSINIYSSTFESKDVVTDAIDSYNDSVDEEQQLTYTDYIGLMMSSITTIINAITYVLIAFVAISLIVSSIMIAVITLISVQERTKEIGILRAIGASKGDVSSMFNAETVIIGFSSGLLGVVVTFILTFPINAIIHNLTGINNLSSHLPLIAAIILVAISVLLTLISGIIPSRSASKKDPVVALRSE